MTNLESAVGVRKDMPILYKGFNVGSVESVQLVDEDQVMVRFHVLEKYKSLIRKGAQVELKTNPIDLGNQFFLYSGIGEELEEEALVPSIDSPQGQELAKQGLSRLPEMDDSVASLIARGNSTLDSFNNLLQKFDAALTGESDTALARIVSNMETASLNASSAVSHLEQALPSILEDVQEILSNTKTITQTIASPKGSLIAMLDTRGPVYKNLEKSIASLALTLSNVEKATSTLPGQATNIAKLIADLKVAIKDAKDVLEALKNNPLLRGGISDKPDNSSGGTNPRNIRF
ncbi:MlaD family protein [Desulfovibrio sp. OttesenSCG-928-M16]|nr:MlaD family protein [Desulfovibrio sp. OttesenSCG-928-M16]